MRTTFRSPFLLLIAGTLVFAACGDDAAEPAGTTEPAPVSDTAADQPAPTPPPTPAPGACADGKTIKPGVLTIATGEPAFPPYVIDNKPETGEGFEAAVAMAVAKQMGFEGAEVAWARSAFDVVTAPGPKDFDLNLQQFTITEDRKKVVDFSDGYYTAAQAIFGLANSPAASAKTLADLQGLKIGVAAGTTSITYIEETIKPKAEPFVFNDNAGAKQALESKQIDAIVSDLPTALYITGVEIEGTKVFGQIEGSGTDQFGILLAKDNPLTACVNEALGALTSSGDLAAITQKWMADYTESPVIKLG